MNTVYKLCIAEGLIPHALKTILDTSPKSEPAQELKLAGLRQVWRHITAQSV